MEPVQYLVAVLLLCGRLVLNSPLMEPTYIMNGRRCNMCPAGTYQTSCTECESCPPGTFTTDWNRENSCDRCFGDCRADYHLKVVQDCNGVSNLKCGCEAGFHCSERVRLKENCAFCVKIRQKNSTATVANSGNDKQMPAFLSSGRHSTCTNSTCDPRSGPPIPDKDMTSSSSSSSSGQLPAILCPVLVVGCVALVSVFCIRQSRNESCFKRALLKFCDERRQTSSYKSRNSSSVKQQQQPPSVSATNLGQVHFHNPGTVVFSLLSQFTGQVGARVGVDNAAEKVGTEEDDETDNPVHHPTSSPTDQFSEEERSAEANGIFFPSQEQGKDWHISKEEEEEL